MARSSRNFEAFIDILTSSSKKCHEAVKGIGAQQGTKLDLYFIEIILALRMDRARKEWMFRKKVDLHRKCPGKRQ